jgi:AhpD family alkylhydroperoxidase
VLAESPQVLEAYKTVQGLFEGSSLDTEARHVVWLAISAENACHYCVPAHTFLAKKAGVRDEVIDALRNGAEIPDRRLETLRRTVAQLRAKHGQLDPSEVQAFFDAGFTKQNLLDVVLGIAHKTISNFVNHLVHTPVDKPFAQYDWHPEQARSAAE